MDRRLYMRQWIAALDRYELLLRPKVARQRNAFIRAAAKNYERNGQVPNHLRTKHEEMLGDILFSHFQKVIPYFGRFTLKDLKHARRIPERKQDGFMVLLMEWARTRALNNASTIADTDIEDVRRAISSGLDGGEGNEQIARGIRAVTGLTPYRAATVARTETHAAATYGAIEESRRLEQEFDIKLVKSWEPTMDDRTRESHREMASAEPIPLNEKFEVDGELLDRPGDPAGSPDNVINCRCAIITEEATE